MKRQVAITGPTPEFLRWSVRQSCTLRSDLEVGSIDATEKRLRAIRVAGLALDRNQVYEGIAAVLIEDRPKAFRVSEVFQVFGGLESVTEQCNQCVANILNQPGRKGSLAGCHGWISRSGAASLAKASDAEASDAKASDAEDKTDEESGSKSIDLAELIEGACDQQVRKSAGELFLPTQEIWYGLWAGRSLSGKSLSFVCELFDRALAQLHDQQDLPVDVLDFRNVLAICAEENLHLDIELIPAGFSDGRRWTIFAHCDHCRAPFQAEQEGCRCCQKPGMGHPEIHRKVRGLRPWVDLGSVIGPDAVAGFLARNRIRDQQDMGS